jgi:ABC-type multidrug transport system ATPase subunit
MQYMLSATKGTRSEQEIKTVLTDMGFCVQMLLNPIRELSGGWRMKLTLAGAILSSADMLLLDEPTNHLDSGSIAWLIAYLNTLTTTTLLIVSHDYDFLVSSSFLTPTSVLFDTHFLMHAQRTKAKSTRREESSRTSCTWRSSLSSTTAAAGAASRRTIRLLLRPCRRRKTLPTSHK